MKKKLLLTFSLVVMLVFVLAVTAFAADYQDPTSKVWFSLDTTNKTATATRSNIAQDFSNEDGTPGHINIPSTITVDGAVYTVTTIYDGAFSGANSSSWGSNSTYSEVTIPSTVTSINSHAFRAAPNLVKITINCSATLPNGFCYSCENLKTIDMSGSTITKLDDNCFVNTSSVEVIKFPSTLTTIGYAFNSSMDKTGGAEVTIEFPASLEKISGKQCFGGCKNLKKVIFNEHPSGVPTLVLGNNIFQSSGVREIVFPRTLLSIGEHTLNTCSSLTTVLMPSTATYHKYMFQSTTTVELTFFQGTKSEAETLYKTFNGGGYGNSSTQFVDFSTYNPNTDYSKNNYCTVFYNTPTTTTCPKCNGIMGATEFIFENATLPMKDQTLCTHCGNGSVTSYAPIFIPRGYSYSLYGESKSISAGVAINFDSYELYNSMVDESKKITSYGLLATLKSSVSDTGCAFDENGERAGVAAVEFSKPTYTKYNIMDMVVTGFTDQEYNGVKLTDTEVYIAAFYKIGDTYYYITEENVGTTLQTAKSFNQLYESDIANQ